MNAGNISLLGALALVIAAPASFAAVEEMIVEANRRAESIQDVPIAVSAFGTEDIQKLQIDSAQDIGDNIPNLQTYAVTANGAAMQLHARGASVQNPGFNTSESPVGIYVDDVYNGRLATANLDFNDIERVEVLRGPQATLYGRNTIAGAIKIYSRTPGDDFWASGSVGYGKYETSKITGSVGGPIQEGAMAASISGVYHDRGEGYFNNEVTGGNPGEYTNKAIRSKLHIYGVDALDLTISLWAVDVENDGWNGVPYEPVPFGLPADPGTPVAGFYSNLSPEGSNFGETDQNGVTIDWTWDFAGGTQLRSISAYASIDDAFGFDIAGGNAGFAGNPGLLVNSDSDMTTISQEFQLLGTAFDDSVEWIAGLYYLNEDGSQNYAGSLPFAFIDFLERSNSETTAKAVFAEATWQFAERWSVTGGARWSQDDKEWSIACSDNAGGGTGSCTPSNGAFEVEIEEDWEKLTPKASLQFDATDDTLLYASVSRGFQAGGFQTLCFGNLECASILYDPQDVWSYEIGQKSDLFNNTVRLNTAVFLAQYEDIQQTVPRVLGGPSFPTENVGDADVWGVELEAYWVPITNLNIFANVGFMDADDITVTGDAGSQRRELPSNPDISARAGADYTLGISDGLEVFFGGDISYVDEYYNAADNSLLIEDYSRLNAFVGVGRPDGRWQLVGEWKNLTNEEDNVSGLVVPFTTNTRTVQPPLEYMVTFKVNY